MKYKVLFSAKVYLEKIIEADSKEETLEKVKKDYLDKNGFYEIDLEESSEILPQEKNYFEIEQIEKYEQRN